MLRSDLDLKMEESIMEKKEYISPIAEIVEIGTLNMLALSKDEVVQIDDTEQMSNEFRGDWENIWGNM